LTPTAQLAAKDLDLSFKEPDAGVTASGASFSEMSENAKPPQHGE